MSAGIPDQERYLHIYCRSKDQKKKFEDLAKEKGASLSGFYLNILEEWLQSGIWKGPAKADSEEINHMREELINLKAANRSLQADLAEKDATIMGLKNKAHLANQGEPDYDTRLLDLLQNGPIQTPRLLEEMYIDFKTDPKGVTSISNQLQRLEAVGLIKKAPRGWSWLK